MYPARVPWRPVRESRWNRDERETSRRRQTGLFFIAITTPRIGAASQVESMSSNLISRKLVERTVGGKLLSIETGYLAKQASGSVVVRIGDTMTLVAVVAGPGREGLDFFPLTVDYREKTYAAGKFPGGFIKREGRPTTKEILTSRLIDRPIRPLFPDSYRDEVQIQAGPISADRQNDPDVLSMIGASAALLLARVPFLGPVGAIRLGRVDGKSSRSRPPTSSRTAIST